MSDILANTLPGSPESQPSRPAPFIGLKPYTEQDQDRFFGRQQDTHILVDKIRAHKLTLLVAASGVGKSSLLEAGVKPDLRKGGERVLLTFRRWFGDPLPELKGALVDDLVGRGRLAPGQRPGLDRPLEELLRIHGLLSGKPLVLFLDQFEELFNYQRLTDRLDPLIRERVAPTAFVFSMREDFAMELNAFEPYLTGVFDNYYRLEKLSAEQARAAIENPVHAIGFHYQPATLVDELLHDLSHREQRERLDVQDAAAGRAAVLRVEPPHLQVVCKTLWELNAASPVRTISGSSYRDAGGADGILDNHFQTAMATLEPREQHLASGAFDYLVSQQGPKMAYPLDELAERLGLGWRGYTRVLRRFGVNLSGWLQGRQRALRQTLDRLQDAAILRRQQRQDRLWYELYHDIFARSIRNWNQTYKTRRLRRRLITTVLALLLTLGLGLLALNTGLNYYGRYLTLSPKGGISDRIEIYGGDPGYPVDLFRRKGFLYETDYLRADLQPNQRFERAPIPERPQTRRDLIGRLSLGEADLAYGRSGLLDKVFEITDLILDSKERDKDQDHILAVIRVLGQVPVAQSLERLDDVLANDRSGAKEKVVAGASLAETRSFSMLLAALDAGDAGVRKGTVSRLGILRIKRAVEPLIERLSKYEDPDVRQAAVRALGSLAERSIIPKLLTWLAYGEVDQQATAAQTLGRLDMESQELTAWRQARVDELTTQVESADAGQRKDAATALGTIYTQPAVELLSQLLADETPEVRIAAIASLGDTGAYRPTLVHPLADRLIALAKDPDPPTHNAAIAALGQLIAFRGQGSPQDLLESDQKIRAALLDIARTFPSNGPNWHLRAIDALGATRREDIAKELFDLLGADPQPDKSSNLRATEQNQRNDIHDYRVYSWLGRIGYPDAVPHLQKRLAHLETLKADWRKRRDQDPATSRSSGQAEPVAQQNEQGLQAWPHEHREYLLGYAIARGEPNKAGIKMLGHRLYQVRQGAIRAQEENARADTGSQTIAAIIRRLRKFNPADLPDPFPYAAYEAIDRGLAALEFSNSEMVLNDLTALQAQLTPLDPEQDMPPKRAALERLDWTIQELRLRLGIDAVDK